MYPSHLELEHLLLEFVEDRVVRLVLLRVGVKRRHTLLFLLKSHDKTVINVFPTMKHCS